MISSTIHSKFRIAALGLLCAGLASPLAAQSRFAAALPEQTLAFISFPDLATSFEEMQQMPLAKMWREDQVQDFFADALKLAEDSWNQSIAQAREQFEAGELPFDPDELIKARLSSMSFALTEFGVTSVAESEPLPRMGFVAHMDFGDTAPIWHNVLTTAMDMMTAEAGDEVTRSLREVAGTQLHVFRPTDEPGLEMGLNVAFVGSGIVVGTLTEDVEGVLERINSNAGGLSATADYKAAASRIDLQGAEAEFYLRPDGLVDSLILGMKTLRDTQDDFPVMVSAEGVDRALTALGLRSMMAIATSSSYVGDRCVNKSFTAIPKDGRRGLTAGDAGTLEMGFLRWIPADAVSFSAGTMDAPAIYQALTDALLAYDEQLGAKMLDQLAQMEEQVDISLERDLFGAFGKNYVFWQMPMAAFGAAPEMALITPVNDPERLVQTLQTVAMMSNGTIDMETVERRGITVHQLRFDLDFGADAMMAFNPADMFIPTIGFKDGHMVVGLSTADVKRAFARMDREDDPSGDIRSNPEFAPCLEQVPTEGLSSLAFTDWKSTFESQYQMITSVLAFIPPDEDIPFDLSLLPDSSTLTQHLFASVSWTRSDDAGTMTETISPFGPEIIAIGGALAGAGLAFYGMSTGGPVFGTTRAR